MGIEIPASEKHLLRIKGYRLSNIIEEGRFSANYLTYFSSKDNLEVLICKAIDIARAPLSFLKNIYEALDILSKIRHPCIPHIQYIVRMESRYFLFTQRANKGDLLSFLMSRGAPEEKLAKVWSWQICLAVQYLHALDIVHRNIKLENILITVEQNAKLWGFSYAKYSTDFKGFPVVFDHSDLPMTLYTAPEIINRITCDSKGMDIWSLGCLMYAMATDRMPFVNATNCKTLYHSQLAGHTTEGLNRFGTLFSHLIRGMLEPVPNKRYDINAIVTSSWFSSFTMTYPEMKVQEKANESRQTRRVCNNEIFQRSIKQRNEWKKAMRIIRDQEIRQALPEGIEEIGRTANGRRSVKMSSALEGRRIEKAVKFKSSTTSLGDIKF